MNMEPPVQCPVCGAYSLTQEGSSSALLAVCDVLVLKALETMGKRIVRANRSRFKALNGRPFHVAHTLWRPAEETVTKALRGAWDVVPALMDGRGFRGVTSEAVTEMLDSYVRGLAYAGARHQVTELAYQFTTQLGLPVYLRDSHDSHMSTS